MHIFVVCTMSCICRYCLRLWCDATQHVGHVPCHQPLLGYSFSLSLSALQSSRKNKVHSHHHSDYRAVSASHSSSSLSQRWLCCLVYANSSLHWAEPKSHILCFSPSYKYYPCYVDICSGNCFLDNS